MVGSRATYLYCIVHDLKAPDPVTVPSGLEGTGPPRLVDAGNALWVVAADAPLARYGSEAIASGLKDLEWVSRCALAHEEVVESFLSHGTVIPFRMFTLFSDDQRAVAHVRETRRSIDEVIERVARRREWGVRIFLDRELASWALREREEAPKEKETAAPGTAFLERKREERALSRDLLDRARRRAEAVYERLAGSAREAARQPVEPGGDGRVLLDASFLVDEGKAADFRSEVAEVAKVATPDGCDVVLTGPWPPYNFTGGRLP